MSSVMERLAELSVETKFEDLSDAAVHEAKRSLIDAVGCALAAGSVEKGRLCVKLSERLAGNPEASVLGTSLRVGVTNAVLANGELINTLDYDALYSPGGHVAPNVIPAALALAEYTRASGRELLVALAIAHEVAIRVTDGMGPTLKFAKRPDGTYGYEWSPVYGDSHFIVGAAAGAARILHLDQEKTENAIGLAGYHTAAPTHRKFSDTVPTAYTKYGPVGWQSTGAVISVLLADIGYRGDKNLFEGDSGFWRLVGSESWDADAVVEGLGTEWRFVRQHYKPYPCCRLVHSPLTLFDQVVAENMLSADDIGSVKVYGHPFSELPPAQNKRLSTAVDAQFSFPYAFSLVAHHVPAGVTWQDPATMAKEEIRGFMDRVSVEVDSRYREGPPEDKMMQYGAVEVSAHGKVYSREGAYARGAPRDGYRLSDDELHNKFLANASHSLAQGKRDRALQLMRQLEEVGDVRELMEEVTLQGGT